VSWNADGSNEEGLGTSLSDIANSILTPEELKGVVDDCRSKCLLGVGV